MGIQNRGGALYWATGIDNSGLKRDKEQAVGILKGFAKQVTGLDVFAGLGAAAAMAFAKITKEAYAFSKRIPNFHEGSADNFMGHSGGL